MKMAWYVKPGNKVIVALSRLGMSFGTKGPVVLTVVGRKSGEPRSTPVTPMMIDGKLYVAAAPGASWVANVRVAGHATLRRGRRSEGKRVVELTEQEARPLLRQLPQRVPGWVGFLRKGGFVDQGTPEEFEALTGTMPIFRFDELPDHRGANR